MTTYRDDPALLTEADRREVDAFRRFLELGLTTGDAGQELPEAWWPYVTGTGPAPPPPEDRSDTMSPTDPASAPAEVKAAAPSAELARRIRESEQAYREADAERRRVFAVAYDSGAMTYGQIGQAADLTDNIVRNLLAGLARDAEDRRAVAAEIALAQLARGAAAE